MNDIPGWIELLFRRGDASRALSTSFLLDLTYRNVNEAVEAHEDGPFQLRQTALGRLDSAVDTEVANALIFLAIVGRPEDTHKVLSLVKLPSEWVQKAAKTRLFALSRPRRENLP